MGCSREIILQTAQFRGGEFHVQVLVLHPGPGQLATAYGASRSVSRAGQSPLTPIRPARVGTRLSGIRAGAPGPSFRPGKGLPPQGHPLTGFVGSSLPGIMSRSAASVTLFG
jgi:hypothetical protein